MFEKYYATLENIEGYGRSDLDRYNLFLETKLAGSGLDPFRDYLELDEETKCLGNKYLTDDPETWPF
jgi:hypothetical protein